MAAFVTLVFERVLKATLIFYPLFSFQSLFLHKLQLRLQDWKRTHKQHPLLMPSSFENTSGFLHFRVLSFCSCAKNLNSVFFSSFIEMQLTCNIVLAQDVQHNDLVSV